ncbi:MAM and LDL-receptor class A domain-containing protein 1-like [Antedon mediterranea]|uniref:MAM and LDL-receptor class A domain-containing protein 1-like n=1 Tax=Antedon mediterranea TaxID=105859 RepID=UPI003AF863BE
MAVKNMKPFVLFAYLLILIGITVSDDLFCNFETDLCGFTHDSSVNGNWRRMYGTGHNLNPFFLNDYPHTDHTYGNNTGYYMFYKKVSRNQQAARIISPYISPISTNNYTVCVQFWYYMEGTVGDLRVRVRTNPSDLLGTPLWSLSGNRGGIWHAAQVQIQENTTRTYQVVFEGDSTSRSSYGFYDSISIDDVTIRKSYCQDTDGDIEIANVSCSFETLDNCGYRQDQSDDFNWRSRRGATDTRYTGPSQDHTFGTELGRYMYIETSQYQLIEGHKARLISPVWTITEPEQCVEFWYHMYGSDTGALSLFIRSAGGAMPADPVVRIVGHHMDVWLRHVYLMNRTGDFELVFEAMCGSGIYGDISLDDVRIYDGPCANNTVEPAVVAIDFLKAGCNFEFDDICNYTQDIADVFDWRRNTGRTPSSNTGPTNDHTYTTSVGHYMYIEASRPRREGDKARLLTQIINNNNTDICISFHYHMYGRGIDFLKIYKKDVGGGLPLDPIYVKHGNQRNVWRLEKVDIKGQTENFQIVFEGTVGNTAYGDIAIDDIEFHAVACGKENLDDVVDFFACDFEGNSSSLCNFEQSQMDNFDWELRNGSTHSLETGPSADHTYGNSKGQYIYIEASDPRRPGERAQLTSPPIDPSTDHVLCLQFWYHMKGEHVGSLKVFRYFYTEGYHQRLMNIEGEQGDRWIEALIPINYDVNNGFIEERIKILLTGVIGKGHLGDIAIDDVSITSHHCFPSGESTTVTELSCDFESGLSQCGFKQSVSDVFDWTFLNASADSQDIANFSTATEGQTNFIYLDMARRGRGDVANIATPTILPNITNRCLTFKYFMKGDAQQQLNVYILGVSGLNDFVGSVSLKNSSQWKTSQFDISVKQDDQQIMFEGVVGFAPRGFIALDDITVKFGTCVRGNIKATIRPTPSSLPSASSNQEKNATTDNDDDDDDDENLDIVSKLFISFTLILLFMILLSVAILVVRRRFVKKSRQAKDEQQFPYSTNQNISADLAVDNPAYEVSILSNLS